VRALVPQAQSQWPRVCTYKIILKTFSIRVIVAPCSLFKGDFKMSQNEWIALFRAARVPFVIEGGYVVTFYKNRRIRHGIHGAHTL
jgi:hypothetical protein